MSAATAIIKALQANNDGEIIAAIRGARKLIIREKIDMHWLNFDATDQASRLDVLRSYERMIKNKDALIREISERTNVWQRQCESLEATVSKLRNQLQRQKRNSKMTNPATAIDKRIRATTLTMNDLRQRLTSMQSEIATLEAARAILAGDQPVEPEQRHDEPAGEQVKAAGNDPFPLAKTYTPAAAAARKAAQKLAEAVAAGLVSKDVGDRKARWIKRKTVESAS